MKPSELAGQEFYVNVLERDETALGSLQHGNNRGPIVGETYLEKATLDNAYNGATPSSRYGEVVVAKCTILTQAELDKIACPF